MLRQTHSPAQAVRTMCELKSRKPCNCTKSHCLKGYCECFASGVLCSSCNCLSCYNNGEHAKERRKAVKLYARRKVNAATGCSCKRSSCLKNYCECFEAGNKCTPSCACVGCRNWPIHLTVNSGLGSVVTAAAVEDACNQLLARAELAEYMDLSPVQAERVVLEEFGRHLTQITKATFSQNCKLYQ